MLYFYPAGLLTSLTRPVSLRKDRSGSADLDHQRPLQNHHLQHQLPDPVQMGSQENVPQPHAQPSDLRRSGSTGFFEFMTAVIITSKNELQLS